MLKKRYVITGAFLLCWCCTLMAQQLKLGSNPSELMKSALLELSSANQGLLFPRLSDTISINSSSPPDGMVIYFIPTRQLMLRANGVWLPLVAGATGAWNIDGNTNGALRILGTRDNFDLPFYTNNAERMRITSAGNIAIGITSTTAKMDVNGTYKLGANGTINKNQISFASTIPSSTSIGGATLVILGLVYTPASRDLTFDIPVTNTPTSTQATVAVSFGADLPASVSVAFARVQLNAGVYQVKMRLLNSGTTTTGTFSTAVPVYFTITEF